MGIFPVHVENPINCNDAFKSGVISDNSLLSEENINIVRFYNLRYAVRFGGTFSKGSFLRS